MVSSPLIANSRADAIVVAAGYDGYVRAYEQRTGKEIWKFGARDHIYASPAQLSDGTIVIPSADGTIYGLDPVKGYLRWSYDTREPIRSSPAVDGHDRIYAGGGDGRLYCLNGDGTLRWAYQLIGAERNDLNASPALGPTAITIAGESGEIFSVPYDWPLTAEGARDPRSILPGHETAQDGARLYWTEPFGARLDAPAGPVDANRPLAFTLAVREEGRTRAALIDPASVRVEVSGAPRTRVEVSADRQFILAVPEPYWTDERGGKVEVRVSGRYRVDPWRFGLKFFGGREGGRFEQRFTLDVPPREGGFPYRIPAAPGDAAGMLEISRLAVPAPTVLPSYNQIGFDSVHYLLGLVEGNGKHAVVWGVAGRLEGAEGKSVVDPSQDVRFALDLDYEGGLVTLSTHEGFTLKFNGWEMPYDLFRIATRVDPASGAPAGTAAGTYIVKTDEIGIYGPFLKLLGVSDTKTGRMYVAAGRISVRMEAAPAMRRKAWARCRSRSARARRWRMSRARISGWANMCSACCSSMRRADIRSASAMRRQRKSRRRRTERWRASASPCRTASPRARCAPTTWSIPIRPTGRSSAMKRGGGRFRRCGVAGRASPSARSDDRAGPDRRRARPRTP